MNAVFFKIHGTYKNIPEEAIGRWVFERAYTEIMFPETHFLTSIITNEIKHINTGNNNDPRI